MKALYWMLFSVLVFSMPLLLLSAFLGLMAESGRRGNPLVALLSCVLLLAAGGGAMTSLKRLFPETRWWFRLISTSTAFVASAMLWLALKNVV